jgi:hypothetical protein
VRALEHPPSFQHLEVAPDRHLGDAELLGQYRDAHHPLLTQQLVDLAVPFRRQRLLHVEPTLPLGDRIERVCPYWIRKRNSSGPDNRTVLARPSDRPGPADRTRLPSWGYAIAAPTTPAVTCAGMRIKATSTD